MNHWFDILLNAETDLKWFKYHSQLISRAIAITVEWPQERLQITVVWLPSTITDSVERFQEQFTVERLPKYDYRLQSSDFQVQLRIQFRDSKSDLQSRDFQSIITDLQSNSFQRRSVCSRTNSQAGSRVIRVAVEGIQDDIQTRKFVDLAIRE